MTEKRTRRPSVLQHRCNGETWDGRCRREGAHPESDGGWYCWQHRGQGVWNTLETGKRRYYAQV